MCGSSASLKLVFSMRLSGEGADNVYASRQRLKWSRLPHPPLLPIAAGWYFPGQRMLVVVVMWLLSLYDGISH